VPKQLAFVLSGGGARGALQIGAVRALLEAGYQPDILVGASVGAVNAAFLTLRGLTLETVDELQQVWLKTPAASLFPSNYLWISARALINRPVKSYSQRMREFFVSQGLGPNVRFKDFHPVRLGLVASDLVSSQLVIYGLNPEQSVLDGVLASIALPPWLLPQQNNGQFLIDGGALSCLPIEPAMALGATEVIALDLIDLRGVPLEGANFRQFVFRLMYTVQQRQAELELALAAERNIPVHRISLQPPEPIELWDFSCTAELIDRGYAMARQEIARWKDEHQSTC
jgi:NTE family protein